ncbi:MAG: proton-conducting transporter membrane subunit [Methanomicrobiales archaeon]|nr:proton-conducting transporter membrane subunit [Methanomicrobiales archaeon]
MDLLFFLILFPFIAAIVLLIIKSDNVRGAVVGVSALLIAAVSVWLLAAYATSGTVFFPVSPEPMGEMMFLIGMGIALFILYMGVRYKNYIAIALTIIQSALMVYFEFGISHGVVPENNFFVDQFTIIMALIIGVIGSLICVYAVSYMKDFHKHHPELKDRRRTFFFIMFIFLTAMFGLVFANNLAWLFFFWEITTLSSFLLIGYTQTDEAMKNSFLALNMNLLGGLAFAGALIWLASTGGGMELDKLIATGGIIALVPAVLISFAGITKSAQFPFSSWLVGAMIAPTPVSALLHSSTMVKAGVYVMVRFAPVLQGTTPGYMIALVGGFTFLLASAIAISQSNAKKVLAYSTIANLGLIVACAGIGTYEAIWAAILLIVFHAVSKSLLFLCVGTVEHQIGSRDIEDMNGLITRMPKVAVMMLIGMAGMFLAPFGMLISKWAAIRAFIDAPYGVIFVVILAFGSALTVFFWAKWMGRLISVPPPAEDAERRVSPTEWLVLSFLAGLMVLTTVLFPLISSYLVEPWLLTIYGHVTLLAQENVVIMLIMLFLLMVLPISMLYYRKDHRQVKPYMGGMTTTSRMHFTGSIGIDREVTLGNYYLESYFGEQKMSKIGIPLCVVLLAIMFAGVAVAGLMH